MKITEGVRPCAGDSGRREAGRKELAKQKAGSKGCGSRRRHFVEQGAAVYLSQT